MAAAVLGLPNAAELASTPAAAITDRICRVRYSVPPTRLGDTAVPLLIRGFGVRVPGGAPGGLHISPGSMFTFGSDILGCLGCAGGRALDDLAGDAVRALRGVAGLGRARGMGMAVMPGEREDGERAAARAGGLAGYGGAAARLARVVRRRLRVLGGRPAAARLSLSACRA